MDDLPAASAGAVPAHDQAAAADQHMAPAGLSGEFERPAGLNNLENEMMLYQKEKELLRQAGQQSVAGREGPAASAGDEAAKDSFESKLTEQMLRRRHNEDSPLLRCLAQVDDDACVQVLLPKLWDVGAAGDVALTCTWLQGLMQRNCQQLSFSYETCRGSSTLDMDTQTAALPDRFPACAEVHLEICTEESYVQAAVLVPVLSKLPKLKCITLRTQYGLNHVGLVLLLRAMRLQLTQLRSLTVDAGACTGWRRATAACEQLASIKQLTSLNLDMGFEPVNLADLGLLGRLTALQELVLVAPSARWSNWYSQQPEPLQQQDDEQEPDAEADQGAEEEHDMGYPVPEQQEQGPEEAEEQAEEQAQQRDCVGLYFLQHLKALTSLRLVMSNLTGFESGVSSCKQLRCLHVGAGLFPGAYPGQQPCLNTAQCEALSGLTCLTELLCGGIKQEDMPVFYAAIKGMRDLDTVALGFKTKWTWDALPVLAGLPRLATVTGAWQDNDPAPGSSTAATHDCLSVRYLLEAAGAVPFSAFSLLEVCALGGSITPSALASMAQHCKHVTEFGDVGDSWDYSCSESYLPNTTLTDAAPVADRVAAIQSLGQLSATLTRITFHALDNAELAALVTATSSCKALDRVVLVVPRYSYGVSIQGLTTHVGRLWRPKALSLVLRGLSLDYDGAVALLSALHPKMKLSLLLRNDKELDILLDAAEEMESMGLALPQLSACEAMQATGYATARQPVMHDQMQAAWPDPMLHMPMLGAPPYLYAPYPPAW